MHSATLQILAGTRRNTLLPTIDLTKCLFDLVKQVRHSLSEFKLTGKTIYKYQMYIYINEYGA